MKQNSYQTIFQSPPPPKEIMKLFNEQFDPGFATKMK